MIRVKCLVSSFVLMVIIGPTGFLHGDEVQERLDRSLRRWVLNDQWDRACGVLKEQALKPQSASALATGVWIHCLERDKHQEEAWHFAYSWTRSRNTVQGAEDIWTTFIDLTAEFFHKTHETRYWKVFQSFLHHTDRFIRYYAAFNLSYWDEKDLRKKALPVLHQILHSEHEPNLLARAQLAWLRVEPRTFESPDVASFQSMATHILIEIIKNDKQEHVRLRLPPDWAIWWLKNDDSFPVDEKTRQRLIDTLERGIQQASDTVLLEVREPDATIRIQVVTQSQDKNDNPK